MSDTIESSQANHQPHQSQRLRKYSTAPPEIPMNEYETNSEEHRRTITKPRLVRMCTTELLADIANNNVVPQQQSELIDDDVDPKLQSNGNFSPSSTRFQGPVIQLINVSIRKLRSNGSSKCHFKSLNCTFTCGKIYVIIGEPGAGKSNLLKTLAKIRQPCKGKVKYLGLGPVFESINSAHTRLSVGFMPQSGGYFAELSAEENFDYFARVHCVQLMVAQNKLHRLMEIIGWERKSLPLALLSPVQRTLVSLALASLHSPAILVLDEPHFGTDLFLKEHIWRQLKQLTIKVSSKFTRIDRA